MENYLNNFYLPYSDTETKEQLICTREVLFEKINQKLLNLRSVVIQVGTRKIHASWSPDLLKDLQTYPSIDIELELNALLDGFD